MKYNKKDYYVLVGLVSQASDNCNGVDSPSLVTDVGAFYKWIKYGIV